MTPSPAFRRSVAALFAALLLAPAVRAQEAGLMAHWRFSTDRLLHGELKAVAGGVAVRLAGSPNFVKDPGPPRVELTGRSEELVVADNLDPALLPRQDLSVTAWVRVDRPAPCGAFLGVVHDNGDF